MNDLVSAVVALSFAGFFMSSKKETAMYILGHIVHLLEDSSVPDHTRNDAHPGVGEDYSPYGKDPFYAISSFALLLSMLLVAISFIRSLHHLTRPIERIYLARTQTTVSLSVIVSVAADVVAIVRTTDVWAGKEKTGELLVEIIGLAIISVASVLIIRRPIIRIISSMKFLPVFGTLITLLAVWPLILQA